MFDNPMLDTKAAKTREKSANALNGGAPNGGGMIAPYKARHQIRFVTATSLFDGHDAAINVTCRIQALRSFALATTVRLTKL